MIVSDEFRLNENRQEILSSLSDDFPYTCLEVELDHLIGRSWHWHTALEIDYVMSGTYCLQTPDHTFLLHPGDVAFINSQVIHDARAQEDNCRLYAQMFDSMFLSGMYGSRMERKYLHPVLNCQPLDVWVFRADNAEDFPAISAVMELIHLNRAGEFDCEFRIRSLLSELWCILLNATDDFRSQKFSSGSRAADAEKLRTMVSFIHARYMEDIQVSDIAQSAGISSRGCSRCFQRAIGTSPMSFLNRHRLRIAAQMLRNTDSSVLDISERCGFSSVSYFGKLFREMFGCTPLRYRKGEQ